MKSQSSIASKVLIAASGTGGHLFPALYIAEALKQASPHIEIEFLGSGRPLEEQIIGRAGFTRHVVQIGGLRRLGIKGFSRWLMQLPKASANVWGLISRFKPDLVIGVGGYVTFLPITLARLRGIPTWIHEAERKPGLANYVLSFLATKVSTAHKDAAFPKLASTLHTGAPLKRELFLMNFRKHSLSTPCRVLITGGSQGADGLDKGIAALKELLARLNVELIHQCRPENQQFLEEEYGSVGVKATVTPFLEKMEQYYEWSDIVITRSGAGAVRELDVVGRPTILVPLPNAQEQLENARSLAGKGQAIIVEEGPEMVIALAAALEKLCREEYYQAFNRSDSQDQGADAATIIAEAALSLIKNPDGSVAKRAT